MATSKNRTGLTTHYASALIIERDPGAPHAALRDADRLTAHLRRAYEVAGLEAPAGVLPDIAAFRQGLQGESMSDISAEVASKVLSMKPAAQAKYGAEVRSRVAQAQPLDIAGPLYAAAGAVLAHVERRWAESADVFAPAFAATVERLGALGAAIKAEGGVVKTLDPAALGADRRVDVLTRLADIEAALSALGALTNLPRTRGPLSPYGAEGLIMRGAAMPAFSDHVLADRRWPTDLALLGAAGGWFGDDVVWDIRGDFADDGTRDDDDAMLEGVAA